MTNPIDDARAWIDSSTTAYEAGEWQQATAAATIAVAMAAVREAELADLTDAEIADQALESTGRATLPTASEAFADRRLNGPVAPIEPVFAGGVGQVPAPH